MRARATWAWILFLIAGGIYFFLYFSDGRTNSVHFALGTAFLLLAFVNFLRARRRGGAGTAPLRLSALRCWVSRLRPVFILSVAIVSCVSGCTDAATRVAYDIERGSTKLGSADGSRATVSHGPRSLPEGCSGAYTLQMGKGMRPNPGEPITSPYTAAISVKCDGGIDYTTTYHLNFVSVPSRLEIRKQIGETVLIDLERVAGKAIIVGLR